MTLNCLPIKPAVGLPPKISAESEPPDHCKTILGKHQSATSPCAPVRYANSSIPLSFKPSFHIGDCAGVVREYRMRDVI